MISLLSTLDAAQVRGCRKLVASPYFGGNEDLLAIYNVLVKLPAEGTTKEAVWRKVFGSGKPYNDVRFRKFSSDLFKLVREFLIQETLEEQPKLREYLYLTALEKRPPVKLLRGVERNLQELAPPEGRERYQAETFLQRHLLEQRKYYLLNYDHRPFDHSNIERVSGELDRYFIVTKLINAVHTQSRLQTERQQYELKLVPDIVQFLDTDPTYLSEPLVALHYYMYKMLAAGDDDTMYERYKQRIFDVGDQLGDRQGYEFFQPALNFCRRRINEGKQAFLAEYLEVYKYALHHGYVFDNAQLDPLQFRNTILTALRLGEYEWAESYIVDYQHKLPKSQRSNAVNYNSATLYFYQKNYDRALEFLRDVEYENTTYNLNAKTMLLAIYYETESFDALDSLFDAITTYLHRHKELPQTAREAFGNLVGFTQRLTRILPGDRRAVELLKADVAGVKYVASRPWLMEKIGEV